VLGNDVVDLDLAPEKLWDQRFLDRVFSPSERDGLLSEADLWSAYAAKEAMFKAVKQLQPERSVPFREIEVGSDRARFEAIEAKLRWERGAGYVHCLAWLGGEPSVWIEDVPEELASIRLREKVQERLTGLGWPDCEIRKDGPERFRPPKIYHGGKWLSETRLSFSHDGRFAALALLLDVEQLDFEDERRVRRNHSARALNPVA